jgi:hypothetical protein
VRTSLIEPAALRGGGLFLGVAFGLAQRADPYRSGPLGRQASIAPSGGLIGAGFPRGFPQIGTATEGVIPLG